MLKPSLNRDLVKKKISTEIEFTPPYAFEIENFWVGGTVRLPGDWRWISHLNNFTDYSYWAAGKEGYGCPKSTGCLQNHALKVNGEKLYWMAEDKNFLLPYICESSCSLGYIWQQKTRKCVKIFRQEKKSASEAAYSCSKEKSRLLSVSSCGQLSNLMKDLRFFWKSNQDKYWLGNSYGISTTRSSENGQRLRGTDSQGRAGFNVRDCSSDQISNVLDDGSKFNPGTGKEYYSYLDMSGKVVFTEAVFTDSSPLNMFLCEKDNDWTCPKGYMLHGQHCLKLFSLFASAGEAEMKCGREEAVVLQLDSIVTLNYLKLWLQEISSSVTSVFLGYRRHTTTVSSSEDSVYISFDGRSQFDIGKFGKPVDGEGDCLILDQTSNSLVIKHSDCAAQHNYICMKKQQPDEEHLWQLLNATQVILPLDQEYKLKAYGQEEKNIKDSKVSILDLKTPTGLIGSAGFLRTLPSFIKLPNNLRVYFSLGITIVAWINIDHSISENQKLLLTDGSRIIGDKSFEFFITKKRGVMLLGAQLCYLERESDEKCMFYYSHSDMKIDLKTWTYVGFTYSTDDDKGTFYINDTYGTESGEGTFFHHTANGWVDQGALKNSITIGTNKERTLSFGGQISCLQIYEHHVNPAQAMFLQKCPVDYNDDTMCPDDYFHYNHRCFRLHGIKTDFTTAEFSCSSDSDYPTR